MEKIWDTYTMEYCSAIKKSEIMSFYINMDGPGDYILSEVRQRKTNILSYMCNLILKKKKKLQMNSITKQKQLHDMRKKQLSMEHPKIPKMYKRG